VGALVCAQPRWFPAAREAWEHHGVRCAIIASPMGGWNGYVQLPWGHPWRGRAWLEVPLPGISWGPDDHGWVGFDTGHAGECWAPDDDSPPYVPGWATPPGVPDADAHAEALEAGVALLRTIRATLAASLPGGRTWTLPMLRARVEEWADLVRMGLPDGPGYWP
jgi:hypothetical protein